MKIYNATTITDITMPRLSVTFLSDEIPLWKFCPVNQTLKKKTEREHNTNSGTGRPTHPRLKNNSRLKYLITFD